MNEIDTPGSDPVGGVVARLAEQDLDDRDLDTLRLLATVYEANDPVPDGLVERLRFGLALDEMLAEVASLSRLPLDATAVRGDTSAATRTETISFSADALTAMLTVVRAPHRRVRVDGWLAPASVMVVRLRMETERRQAVSDSTGRFSFDDLPEGFAQLTFHEPDGEQPGDAVVVTPLFEL